MSLIFILAGSLMACQAINPANDAPPPAVAKAHNVMARTIDIPVMRKQYALATRNVDSVRKLRLIPVVATEEAGRSPLPEYRLFGITPQSVYALLDLRDGDILISANDYVLNDAERFRGYVQVLHLEPGETFVEVRRGGEEVILRYQFQ